MRILVTGASGQLGAYLLRELQRRGRDALAWTGSRRGELFGFNLQSVDLADRDAVVAAFRAARPDVVIHAAALSAIADCYREPQRAEQVNARGTGLLAELGAESGARLVYVSTDLVFDGTKSWYRESDATGPLSIYARSKVAGEQAVRAFPRHAIARVSLLFGPSLVGRVSFFDEQLAALRAGTTRRLFVDEWRTPLSLAVAAEGLLALAASDFAGVLHLGGPERLSRLEMGQRLARWLGSSAEIVPVSRDSVAAPEARPRDVSLDTTQWRAFFPSQERPSWEEALAQLGVVP
jgi:dTDP-4-dehydrorhamnose reductase